MINKFKSDKILFKKKKYIQTTIFIIETLVRSHMMTIMSLFLITW